MQTIDQIEADLDLSPRLLRTSRLVLRVGSTAATLRGSVAARGSAPLRTLNLKQDLILDLQGQINPGRTADIARFLPDNLVVRAAFRASGRIAGTPGAPTGEADIILTSPETLGERWQQGTVRVQLLPDGIELGPLLLQRGTERVSGALHLGKDGGLKGRLVGAGLDLSGLNFLADSRVAGRADIQADVQGSASESASGRQRHLRGPALPGHPARPRRRRVQHRQAGHGAGSDHPERCAANAAEPRPSSGSQPAA